MSENGKREVTESDLDKHLSLLKESSYSIVFSLNDKGYIPSKDYDEKIGFYEKRKDSQKISRLLHWALTDGFEDKVLVYAPKDANGTSPNMVFRLIPELEALKAENHEKFEEEVRARIGKSIGRYKDEKRWPRDGYLWHAFNGQSLS